MISNNISEGETPHKIERSCRRNLQQLFAIWPIGKYNFPIRHKFNYASVFVLTTRQSVSFHLSKHPVNRICKVVPQAVSIRTGTNIIRIIVHTAKSICVVRNINIVDATVSSTYLFNYFLI